MCLVALAALPLAPPAAATDYIVNANPYNVTHTISLAGLWNAYELTATSGQQVTYTMTVTTQGGCAMLFFIQGHTVSMSSQYYTAYSEKNCVSSFTKTFPVSSSDGTEFSIAIMTTSSLDVAYNLGVSIATPAFPPVVIFIVVGALAGAVIGAIAYVVRKRRKPAAAPMPPAAPWTPAYPPMPPQEPGLPQMPPELPPQAPPP